MNLNNVLSIKDHEGNEADCILTNSNLIRSSENKTTANQSININMLNVCNVHKMDEAKKSLNNNNTHVLSLTNPKVWSNIERTKNSSVLNSSVHNNWTLDDFDLLKLDDLDLDEEDGWLYKLPQKRPSPISPYKWIREEFDHPESGIPDVTSTLLQTLKNIIQSRGGLPVSMKTFTRQKRSLLNKKVVVSNIDDPTSLPKDDHKDIDSRTSTKNHLTDAVARIQRIDYSASGNRESRLIRRNGGEGMVESRWFVGGDSSGGSLDDCLHDTGQHRATDVTDVKLLAKMQEDSLRQSFSTSTQRSLKSELNKSTGHLLDNLGHGSPAYRSAHSSPGRAYGQSVKCLSTDLTEVNKSQDSLTSSSGSNSPPDCLANISQPLTKKSPGVHKRSLPNLSKSSHLGLPLPDRSQLPPERDSTPSDESSDTPSTQLSQPIYRSGLRKPSPKVVTPVSRSMQGSPSPSKSPVTSVAPPKSGIPTPKGASSIPRPNSGSKLRTPTKIGGMRRILTTPTQNDSSWREGCF